MASVIRSTRLLAPRGMRMLQARTYAGEPLKLTLAAANKIFYDKVEVKQVDVPSFSGDFGILATHVPTLGKRHLSVHHPLNELSLANKSNFDFLQFIFQPF